MPTLKLLLKFCAGALAALLATELVLQALPVSTATRMDFYVDPFIKTYPPNWQFRASSLWDLRQPVSQKTNSAGFASSVERAIALPGLALIGDSFVEGTGVAEHSRVTERLRAYAPEVDTIMLGSPGTSLLDYLDRIRWAQKRFNVNNFVIFVEANDGNEAVCGSGQHLRRCFNPTTAKIDVTEAEARNGIKNFFGNFASLQYFLGHLKLTPERLMKALISKKPSETSEFPPFGPLRSPISAVAIEHFLSELSQMKSARLMLVLDCNRRALYAGKNPADAPTHAELKERNKKYNLQIVEACPRFKERFARDGLRTEISLTDAHWNARGHDIVAQLVAEEWKKRFTAP